VAVSTLQKLPHQSEETCQGEDREYGLSNRPPACGCRRLVAGKEEDGEQDEASDCGQNLETKANEPILARSRLPSRLARHCRLRMRTQHGQYLTRRLRSRQVAVGTGYRRIWYRDRMGFETCGPPPWLAVAAASLNLSGILIGSGMPMVGCACAAFGAFTLGVLTAMTA
jgi:hypothetical protein